MRYLMVSVMAAFIVATTATAYTHPEGPRGEAAYVEIVSEGGGTFLTIPHRDYWKGETRIIKKYQEARKGENYGIVIRNMTSGRIGVVIAVDGRNIISGRKSDLRNTEEMYIVNGYEQARYDGWRTERDRVHKFYFTDTADSYAIRTFADSSSMGVIAVAVYREKERPPQLYERSLQRTAPAAPSAGSPARGKSDAATTEAAGTGFGDEQYSPTVRVAFEPERSPVQKTLIRYEWRKTLCRKGLLQCRNEQGNRLWDEDDYAPYPPAYRRR